MKRNVVTVIKPFIDDIRLIGTVITERGTVARNKCKIYIREVGYIIVDHSYAEMDKLQNDYTHGHRDKKVGF